MPPTAVRLGSACANPAGRIPLALAILLVTLLLAACGGDDAPREGAATTDDTAAAADQGGWWVYEGPDFTLASGGLTPSDISNSTGSLWRLEYTTASQTIQLTADRADSLFAELSEASPAVGTATVDGLEATLRQHPGSPENGIPPSVGAEWVDGNFFLSFGGPGLTEEELRGHLSHVRRVTRAEWEAAVAAVEQETS